MLDPRIIPGMNAQKIAQALREIDGEIPERILAVLRADKRATVRKLAERAETKPATVPDIDLMAIERGLREEGAEMIAGVDEAGRGPLAGPVVAAAVILPPECEIPGLWDSKKLTEEQREALVPVIRDVAIAAEVEVVGPEVIDEINILQATLRAMRESIMRLDPAPDHVIIDGTGAPHSRYRETTVIKGDAKSLSIAAASVLAKVTRDEIMKEADAKWPGYGFAQHKGYGTPQHHAALKELGPTPIHRRSFYGVVESDKDASPGYANMSRGIRMAESIEDLEAVGRAIHDQVSEVTEDEVESLRRHYKRRLAQLRREEAG